MLQRITQHQIDFTVLNTDELREMNYARKKAPPGRQDPQIGEKVRISKVKNVFAKCYLPNWTEKLFTIVRINRKYTPTTYSLIHYKSDPIIGNFYRHELEPVLSPRGQNDVFIIARIVRRQTRQGVQWAHVK